MEYELLIPSIMLYAILIFLRYRSGARVYTVLAVGIIVFLATQYINHIPMVITFVGLIIYHLWDTFQGRD